MTAGRKLKALSKVDKAWRETYLTISAEMAEQARLFRLIENSAHHEACAQHFDAASKRHFDKAMAIGCDGDAA